jgi:hypothetical protein
VTKWGKSYVPGFWSVKGVRVTVLTLILAYVATSRSLRGLLRSEIKLKLKNR